MKRIVLFVFCIINFSCYAQQAMRFEVAKAKGIFPAVDEQYKSAIDADSSKAVFTNEADVEKHIQAYKDFLFGLGEFLEKNGFYWQDNTRCFNRIYINADGTVDYFLYQFKTKLPESKEHEFSALLEKYISENKFGITAQENFAQCSPVVYPKSDR